MGKTEGGKRADYENYHRDKEYSDSEQQFENIFSKRVELILTYKKSGHSLEIGSSSGLLLSLLKSKGWSVIGVEPSASGKKAVERGVKTLNSTFEKARLEQNTFDLIIINHTLEHLEKPLDVLTKAHTLLKKGGLIFIGAPNFGGLTAKTRGANWQYLLPAEHLWHFTPHSLSLLITKTGFSPVQTITYSGLWEYGNPAKELLDSLFGFRKRFFTNVVTAIPAYILSKIGMGSGLILIAQKK